MAVSSIVVGVAVVSGTGCIQGYLSAASLRIRGARSATVGVPTGLAAAIYTSTINSMGEFALVSCGYNASLIVLVIDDQLFTCSDQFLLAL
ncbi:UNVERIFIED_CONTAM: hypothetical protein Sradi_6229800 [Sesamum radiatum]|uniref:Uncharacterized protein n=1 Tax=Sesamum radiatum TaxID=300843 RepID=A0AAW2K9W3_SESRA